MSSPIVSLRPIEPSDRAALAAAFERLSDDSRYRRFMGPKKVLLPRELTYLTEVDHVTHEAVVAVDDATGDIVGVARYAIAADGVPDFAVVVADAWQGKGLGTVLSRTLLLCAIGNGFTTVTASTLWENDPARRLLARLGFVPRATSKGVVDLVLALSPAGDDRGSVGRWSSVS